MKRLASVFLAGTLAATAAAGCSLTGGTLGGREKCWDPSDTRIASLMQGTLRFGVEGPYLMTPEGEELALRLNRFDLRTEGQATAIADPAGGQTVAADGDAVTLFGGLGADGSMYVCGVEERSRP